MTSGGFSFDVDDTAIAALVGGREVEQDLRARAENVEKEARRRAPVSADGSNGRPPGYLRSKIEAQFHRDAEGLYFDVASSATNSSGEAYGLFPEVGTKDMPAEPYLRPALDAINRA